MLREARPGVDRETLLVWTGLLAVATLLAVVVALEPLAAGLVLLLPLLALPVAFYYRPHWAISAFIVILPFHSLLITLLIAPVGLPLSLGRLAAAWKELLLVGTAAAVILRVLLRGRAPRPTFADLAVLGWLGTLCVYFVVGLITRPGVGLTVHLYGLRDWLLYPLPYIIGRLVTVRSPGAQGYLALIAWVCFITSIIAIVEYFFVPISWHVRLGVPFYFGSFLNLSYPDYLFGLPPNYWAEVAGRPVRRAVSVYLSGQGFALPFLLFWPVVLYRYLERATWLNRLMLAVCGIGLVLSITRMTIIVCFVQLVLMLLLLRRYRLLLGLGALLIAVFLAGLLVSLPFRTFVINTLTLSDTSASARPQQWLNGMRLLVEQPLGLGLGFAGQVGARFGQGGVGAEAGYFKLTGDLGLSGLILFFSLFLGVLGPAYAVARRKQDPGRGLGVVILIASIGFMLNNLTAPPDQSPVLMYIFWALAGVLVTYWQQSRRRIAATVSAATG